MAQQEFCQNCSQRQSCRTVYERLGKAEGPSVVSKIVAAFLLPAIVFIGVLAVFDVIFAKAASTNALQTVFSFLSALSVTSVCVLIMSRFRINSHKRHRR